MNDKIDKENKITIYISDEHRRTWNEIEELARNERRGIGFIICEKWDKMKSA